MAENVVDALIVTLGLDSSDYQQGMEDAERSTREFSEKAPREAERGLNAIEAKFGATFRGIFHTFIAPLTAALGTMGIFSSYTQTADRIGKTAARIGASAEDLQAFGEAAKRAGGSVEGFMGAFESLNGQLQRMQAMGGKGRIAPILKQLGISATEHGQVKDTFQILRELAGASERLGKQKFAGLARFLGLDQGTIMLLQSGRVAMDELISRQKALGVYTKEDFEITQKFNDAISDLQQVFKSLAAVILRVIVPPIRMIAEAMTAVIKTFREHQGFIVAGLTVIAGIMSGTLLTAAKALGAALMPLLAPIAAIAALGSIFDEIAVYAEGGETLFEPLWKAIGTPEDFKAALDTIKNLADSVWNTISDLAAEVGGAFIDTVSEWAASFDAGAFIDTLKGVWEGITDALAPLKDAFEPFKDAIVSLKPMLESVAKLAGSLVTAIIGIFEPPAPGEEWGALRKVAEFAAQGIEELSNIAKTAFGWIEKTAKGLKEFLDSGGLAGLAPAIEPLEKAFKSIYNVASQLLGLFGDIVKTVVSIFTPDAPGDGWTSLETIVNIISLGLQSLAYVTEQVFNWVGNIIAKAHEMVTSFEFINKLKAIVSEMLAAIVKFFNPEEPGGAWHVLKSIIDGLRGAIDLMIVSVKTLFAWVEKVLRGLGAWWNGGDRMQADAKDQITGGDEKKYVAEQAAEIKKANPALTDEQATQAAKAQLKQDAKLKSNYDVLRNYDADFRNSVLQEMGYSLSEIAAFEKRQKATITPPPVSQNNAATQQQKKQGWFDSWWNSGKADTANLPVASVAGVKADTTQISQDNRKSVNVKYDTNVTNNNTFNGIDNSAAIQTAVSRGSREGTERGLTLAPVNEGVF